MTPDQALERALWGIIGNPYVPKEHRGIPLFPSPKQVAMFLVDHFWLLYGGAAGAGKTTGALLDAIRFVHIPRYRAVFYRRTYPELNESEGLIDTIKSWIANTDAIWHEQKHEVQWPNGAKFAFRHILNEKAMRAAMKGSTYNRGYWDEATTFPFDWIQKIAGTRIRVPKRGPLSKIPRAARLLSNPGGEGHEEIFRNFVNPQTRVYPFIPSRVGDNPGLDAETYAEQMREALGPVTLARMLEGDWTVIEGGHLFDRSKVKFLDAAPTGLRCRAWDCAGTTGPKSKFTAGVRGTLMTDENGGFAGFAIDDVRRFKKRPGERDQEIQAAAESDGRGTMVKIEQEGGSGGVKQAEDHVQMLAGYDVTVDRDTGDKFARAGPLARQWEAGNVYIVRSGPWVGPFLDELHAAQPGATYLDQMDAAADCFNFLTRNGPTQAYTSGRPKRERATDRRLFGAQGGRLFG